MRAHAVKSTHARVFVRVRECNRFKQFIIEPHDDATRATESIIIIIIIIIIIKKRIVLY